MREVLTLAKHCSGGLILGFSQFEATAGTWKKDTPFKHKDLGIEARSIGLTDYPTSFPLREVLTLAKHCSGGLILGFSQFEATAGTWKKDTPFKHKVGKNKPVQFPTP